MQLTASGIGISFGARQILTNVSFGVQKGDKIGLIGRNGAGKTTLFKILTKQLKPDAGSVLIPADTTFGLLTQTPELNEEETIYENLLHAFDDVFALEAELMHLQEEIANNNINVVEQEKMLAQYAEKMDVYESRDAYSIHSRVRGMIYGFGFREEEANRPVERLSGGQQNKVAFAKLLLSEPDVLLLDEPTNFFDITSIAWLENYLSECSSTVITISHDRHFLDRTVKRIFEIENGKLTIYDGNYTDYLRRREIDIAVKREQFENQQKEIARQEEIITRFKQFNREKSIRQAESRQKALDKMELLEKPQGSAAVVELVFHQASPSVKQVLQFDSVTKRYGDKTVIDNFSQLIYRKQKVGIFGANGTGKSTLLKMIAGEEVPDKGQIIAGQNVKTAYYAQQQSFTCETVLEEILYTAEQSLTYTQARNYLASFLFFGEDVQKEIAILSGGEKSRLSLLKTMLAGANLVLLDEPTNHLDIASIEALERAINSYDGTLVMVSHDRQFLNNTCDHLLVFENGVIQPYDGNYAYYLSRIEQQRKEGGQIAEKVKPKREKRDYTLKKMQNKIAVLESEIAALQAQITADEEKMCDEDFYKQADSSDVVLKYQENKALLEEYEEQWLVLSEEYLQNR